MLSLLDGHAHDGAPDGCISYPGPKIDKRALCLLVAS
jgi:hypothetical protein